MQSDRKIYKIHILKGKQAIFYIRDGFMTHVDDPMYPLSFGSTYSWSFEKGYERISNQSTQTNRIYLPTTVISKKEISLFIISNIKNLEKDYSNLEGNIIILTRDLDDDTVDIAVTISCAKTTHEWSALYSFM